MRRYEETHPWITFADRLAPDNWKLWSHLGEARSKCDHLAGTALNPDVAREMWRVTMLKGAVATTAIEGNTISFEEAERFSRGQNMPESRQYQQREIENVLKALGEISDQIKRGEDIKLTPELIRSFNLKVLDGTLLRDGVTPGKVRQGSVGVGNYRGAPAEDCELLLQKLCDWLNSDGFKHERPEEFFAMTLFAAIVAHVYIAWIHPFDDGNGRTARLIEFLILAKSGKVPVLAAALMSDHYNLTRDRYYIELDKSSRLKDLSGFANYAIEGFVDGIRAQITKVREQQLRVAWINYVHERMDRQAVSKATARQRRLVLAMGDGPHHRDDLTTLTEKVKNDYREVGARTLGRDLNLLKKELLVSQVTDGKWIANCFLVEAFMPIIASAGDGAWRRPLSEAFFGSFDKLIP